MMSPANSRLLLPAWRRTAILAMALIATSACRSTTALQHSGMWGLNDRATMRGWASLTFDVANLTQIEDSYKQAGIRVKIIPETSANGRPWQGLGSRPQPELI